MSNSKGTPSGTPKALRLVMPLSDPSTVKMTCRALPERIVKEDVMDKILSGGLLGGPKEERDARPKEI